MSDQHPTAPALPIAGDPEIALRQLLAEFAPEGWDILRPAGLSVWEAERRRGNAISVHVAPTLGELRAKLEADR